MRGIKLRIITCETANFYLPKYPKIVACCNSMLAATRNFSTYKAISVYGRTYIQLSGSQLILSSDMLPLRCPKPFPSESSCAGSPMHAVIGTTNCCCREIEITIRQIKKNITGWLVKLTKKLSHLQKTWCALILVKIACNRFDFKKIA